MSATRSGFSLSLNLNVSLSLSLSQSQSLSLSLSLSISMSLIEIEVGDRDPFRCRRTAAPIPKNRPVRRGRHTQRRQPADGCCPRPVRWARRNGGRDSGGRRAGVSVAAGATGGAGRAPREGPRPLRKGTTAAAGADYDTEPEKRVGSRSLGPRQGTGIRYLHYLYVPVYIHHLHVLVCILYHTYYTLYHVHV